MASSCLAGFFLWLQEGIYLLSALRSADLLYCAPPMQLPAVPTITAVPRPAGDSSELEQEDWPPPRDRPHQLDAPRRVRASPGLNPQFAKRITAFLITAKRRLSRGCGSPQRVEEWRGRSQHSRQLQNGVAYTSCLLLESLPCLTALVAVALGQGLAQ